jgi:hypothetical protein
MPSASTRDKELSSIGTDNQYSAARPAPTPRLSPKKHPALKDEIARLLREMGDTPGAVAATLTTNNVQGVRNTVHTLNLVVRYIQVRVKSEAIEFDVIKGDALSITYPRTDMRK